MATVAIARDDDIARTIDAALGHVDLEPIVRGRLVAVKPNETWDSAEDTTGVTQGDTLRAVLRHLKRFGPRELVVTGGAGAAETEDVFRFAGMTGRSRPRARRSSTTTGRRSCRSTWTTRRTRTSRARSGP
jgi:uncharacterized protein (DUF362 family)